jgi:hypothetical protein
MVKPFPFKRAAALAFAVALPFVSSASASVRGMPKAGQPSLPRFGHSQVWTGEQLIIWGGARGEGRSRKTLASGGSYRPGQGRWYALPSQGAPSARFGHTAVWTGEEMIVWGGMSAGGTRMNSGARYNPVTRTWTPISGTEAPSPRAGHTAVWTGEEMIIWGGDLITADTSLNGGDSSAGAAYNPITNQWRPISMDGAPTPRIGHAAVWTGKYMAVWGGTQVWRERGAWYRYHAGQKTGALYDPQQDTWQSIMPDWTYQSYIDATQDRADLLETSADLVWTGSKLIAFPLNGSLRSWWQAGGIYDIESGEWTRISTAGAPGVRPYGVVWTGQRLVAIGSSGNRMRTSVYSFGSESWRSLASARTGSFQGRRISWVPESLEIFTSGGRWANGRGQYSGGSYGQRGFRIMVRP